MATEALADRFDHIVLTVNDIEETTKFYERVLDFKREVFQGSDGQPRYALRFGKQKINLQDRATDTTGGYGVPATVANFFVFFKLRRTVGSNGATGTFGTLAAYGTVGTTGTFKVF